MKLDGRAAERLTEMQAAIAEEPTRIRTLFPAAFRQVARDDEVRTRLLDTLAATVTDPASLAQELADLYRFGDAHERRAVLAGLDGPSGDRIASRGVPLLEDALRTNDPRLVATALGRYAARHLSDPTWRQAVLKCLFTGVPLGLVSDLGRRADDRLRAMVRAYADERAAAGRAVPADALQLLAVHSTRSALPCHSRKGA